MYAAKRFCCGPGADKRDPTKQIYIKLSVYDTVVVGGRSKTLSGKGFLFDIGGHRFFTKLTAVEQMWRDVLGPELLV